MDWTKQAEEIVKNWSDAQQKLWQQAVQGMEGAMGGEKWTKMFTDWEANVKETLGAQGEWLDNWFNSATLENMPEEMKQWVSQGQTMSAQWRETQQQMWQGWFDLVREMNPAGMGNAAAAMTKEGEKILAGWQSAAQEMVNAQMNMFTQWMPGRGAAADEKKAK